MVEHEDGELCWHMFLETRGDWCILLFHTHTQLFSLKITGVEEIFINATTLDSVGFVWGRCEADPRRASGASWRGTDKGLTIGLPWRKPKQVAGRPSATKHWQNMLYASIIAGDELPDGVGLEPPAWWKRGDGLSPPEAPPAEASEALDHVDADPEPAHVEDDADPEPGHVEESPMKKRKKSDPGYQTQKLVPLFRGVAAGATRRGHAEVVGGGEEALSVLLTDPQGHTAALAETTIGAQCYGQASRPVGGTDHIVDGRGREGHCTSAFVRVRHLRRHGSGARQNWCSLAAVGTLGADLSVEAGTVIQACRRVLAERARSRCEARSTTELTTESAMDTAQVRDRGRTRHQRRRNFATYDSSQRDWLVREGREDEASAGW